MKKKEELDVILQDYLRDGPLGQMIHHPLIIEIIYDENFNTMINQRFKRKEQEVALALHNKDYSRYLFLHERPYRANALNEILHVIPKEKYWDLVHSVYIDTENYYENKKFWDMVFTSTFDVPEKYKLQTEEKEVLVYRGFSEKGAERGISWTLDKEVAMWFANRWNQKQPGVAVAKVDRSQIVCYYEGRSEKEVILNPEFVKKMDLEIIKDTPINKKRKM